MVYTQPWTDSLVKDQEALRNYFNNCLDLKINEVYASEGNKRGRMLSLGSRKSINFFRVYPSALGLRFELEIKRFNRKTKFTQSIEQYVLTGQLTKLERRPVLHFVRSFSKRLALSLPYARWFLHTNRILFKKQKISQEYCQSTYLRRIQSRRLTNEKNTLGIHRRVVFFR